MEECARYSNGQTVELSCGQQKKAGYSLRLYPAVMPAWRREITMSDVLRCFEESMNVSEQSGHHFLTALNSV